MKYLLVLLLLPALVLSDVVEKIAENETVLQEPKLENGNVTLAKVAENANATLEKVLEPNKVADNSTIAVEKVVEKQVVEREKFEEEEFHGPIRKCRKGTDEQVNQCFKRILADLKPRLATGIPEIGLQPLDPFHISKLRFQQGRGALVIKAMFTNITVTHFSEFRNAEFKIKSSEKRVYFLMDVPRLRLEGTYSLDGRVFVFPLGGTGPYWIQLGNLAVKGYCDLKVSVDPKTSMKFVQVDKVTLDLKIGEIKVNLLNLFNGNEVLGPVVNSILNDNAQDLFLEMKPEIMKVVSNIVVSIANSIIRNMNFIVPIVE